MVYSALTDGRHVQDTNNHADNSSAGLTDKNLNTCTGMDSGNPSSINYYYFSLQGECVLCTIRIPLLKLMSKSLLDAQRERERENNDCAFHSLHSTAEDATLPCSHFQKSSCKILGKTQAKTSSPLEHLTSMPRQTTFICRHQYNR